MTTLPRAATSPELALLRSDNQSSRLYLTIHSPATVYTARLATVPASTDKVSEITYNTGSGTLANVLQDQTLLIGSASGLADYGIARIRKDGTTTSGTFYIGETSEVNWQANAYLTVLDTFELWPRHVKIDTDGTTPLMDYDVAYTNQNETAGAVPTPIAGPHAVLWLHGATVTYSPDASSSWVKDGTIAAYAWSCTGATITGGTTATPTFTFSSVGTYRLDLTVTGSNSVTFVGHRVICVVDETHGVTTQFTIDNCGGDYSAGGWSFRVTLYDEATLALIRDRALVILHAVDYYGNTQQSIGYVAGAENIVAIGWIAGESIVRGADDQWGSVSFDVQGPQYWFGKMTAFPSGVKDVSDATTPNKWTKFRGLTLNKAIYHFMRWRTTATRMMDVYPNTDTRRHKRLEAPGGQNIWSQLQEICKRSMLVNPCCDRYGRIFFELEQQLVSDRSAFPTVQALTSADWQGDLKIERTPTDEAALIDLSGIAWDGVTATPFFSLAPGHVFRHYGSVEVVDRLMLTPLQSDTNTLAGLYSAWKNNDYKRIDISLASNHRLFDIAPQQRFTLAIAATDTPRGIVESLTMIPRNISYNFSDEVQLTSATFEAEVTADIAVTGDTPADPPSPPIQPVDPPIVVPPIDPSVPSDAQTVWLQTAKKMVWATGDTAKLGASVWTEIASYPGVYNPTDYTIYLFWCDLVGALYVMITDNGYPVAPPNNHEWIFKCANPTEAVPVWTQLLTAGQWITASGMGLAQIQNVGAFRSHGNTILVQVSVKDTGLHAYNVNGECSGSAWGWLGWNEVHTVDNAAYGYRYIVTNNGANYSEMRQALYGGGQGSLIASWLNGDGAYSSALKCPPNAQYYIHRKHSGVDHVYSVPNNADLLSGFNGVSQDLIVGYYAPIITFVDNDNKLWVSTDGSNFYQKPVAWASGLVISAQKLAATTLFWKPRTVLASNEAMRVSVDAGTTWIDATGNFWSIFSGDQTINNMQVVYKP